MLPILLPSRLSLCVLSLSRERKYLRTGTSLTNTDGAHEQYVQLTIGQKRAREERASDRSAATHAKARRLSRAVEKQHTRRPTRRMTKIRDRASSEGPSFEQGREHVAKYTSEPDGSQTAGAVDKASIGTVTSIVE